MISEKAKEWLNDNYSYTNPYFMNSQTVWEVLTLARAGNGYANEVWENYRNKKNLPSATEYKVKTFKELVCDIYNV